jgi:hypothetical protein
MTVNYDQAQTAGLMMPTDRGGLCDLQFPTPALSDAEAAGDL